jgi:hypothetical protein
MTEPHEVAAARKAVQDAPSQARAEVFQAEALRLFALVRKGKLEKDTAVNALHDIAYFCDVRMTGVLADDVIREAMWGRRAPLGRLPQSINGVANSGRVFQPAPKTATAHKTIKATPYVWTDPTTIPPRAWLYGRHLARRYVSTTVAPGGVGKSSLAIVEALAMVTGRDLLGKMPTGKLRVWYWNGEDPLEEIERRIAAVCLHYKITPADIGGRLFINSGRDTAIKIATEQKSGFSIAVPVVEEVTQTIIDNKIDVMIVDPFVSSHSVSENDNMKIDAVAKTWGAIADLTNCAIELVHHVRKGAHGQFEHTVEDGRGAGALVAAARSARVANVMSEEEATTFGVKQRRLYFRVDNGKANLAPPPEHADWYHIISVDLGNATDERPSDDVGVVTEWCPPNPFDQVTSHHLEKVMKLVSEGDYRESSQAKDWVGHVVAEVLGLDLDEPVAKSKVKTLLKQWIKNGALSVVKKPDAKREMRDFVVAGMVRKIEPAAP